MKQYLILIWLIIAIPMLGKAQEKERKVQYLFDAGLNINELSRESDFYPIGLSAAVKAYFVKPKFGLRLRSEHWFRADAAEWEYLSDLTKGQVYSFKPKNYQVFAFEAYKVFTFGKDKPKEFEVGAGYGRVNPYYFYTPTVDSSYIPGTNTKYYVYSGVGNGYQNIVTVFMGIPIQWFHLELRAKFPVGRPLQTSYIKGVPSTMFNLTAYCTFPRKYYTKK